MLTASLFLGGCGNTDQATEASSPSPSEPSPTDTAQPEGSPSPEETDEDDAEETADPDEPQQEETVEGQIVGGGSADIGDLAMSGRELRDEDGEVFEAQAEVINGPGVQPIEPDELSDWSVRGTEGASETMPNGYTITILDYYEGEPLPEDQDGSAGWVNVSVEPPDEE